MLRQYKVAIAAITLATGLTMSGCGQSSTSQGGVDANTGLTSIKVIKPSPASDTFALTLGKQQGIFKKHGIKLVEVDAPHVGSNQIAALLNGQLDIGLGSVTGVMTAVTKGLKVRVLCGTAADNKMDGKTLYDTLVSAKSSIKNYKDLEGKTVALNSLKSTWQASMNEAITKDGGDPAKVKYVQLTFPNQIPALTQGHVDAIFTTQPFASAIIKQGYRSIGDPQEKALDNQHGVATVMQASQSFLDKNPKAAKDFVAALQEASDYANSHPDVVRKIGLANATGAAASAISTAPLPLYTTKITAQDIEKWGALQVKYGFDKSSPSASKVLWTAAKS